MMLDGVVSRLAVTHMLEAEATLARGDHMVEEMRREAIEAARRGSMRTEGDPPKP